MRVTHPKERLAVAIDCVIPAGGEESIGIRGYTVAMTMGAVEFSFELGRDQIQSPKPACFVVVHVGAPAFA